MNDLHKAAFPQLGRPFDDYARGGSVGSAIIQAGKHEAQELIDAVAALNSAVTRARKSGWIVDVTLYQAPEGTGSSQPDPTICATILKAI